MSGRKASEVNGLLSRGDETRKVSISNFNNVISKCQKEINENNDEYEDKYNSIKNMNLDFSKEATQELSVEVADIEKRFKHIKGSISLKRANLSEITNKNSAFNDKLKSLDDETTQLYNKVRGKSDYCDAEYNRANQILNEYVNIANSRNSLSNDAKNIASRTNIDIQNILGKYKELEDLKQTAKKINQKAEEIVKLREKASEIKTFIENRINNIDDSLAKKFLNNDYDEIINLVNETTKLDDKSIISKFNKAEEKISLFINELASKIAEFEQKKAETQALIEENESLFIFDKFYDPLDYLKNEDDAVAKTLEEFLTEYANKEYIDDIISGINMSNQLLEKEDFVKSQEKSNEVRQLIEKAISYANIKQENLIKNVHLAEDIRNVMIKLNYKAKTSILGGNIGNGLKVTCTVGDETIDFDKILIDDNGEVVMDIDHTESVTGTCHLKWEELQKEFVNNGIMLQDVTKNGKSVIYRSKTQTTNTADKEQQRG